jgi:hypothetical protein
MHHPLFCVDGLNREMMVSVKLIDLLVSLENSKSEEKI